MLARKGDSDGADKLIASAAELVDPTDWLMLKHEFARARAEVARLAGRPGEQREALECALSFAEAKGCVVAARRDREALAALPTQRGSAWRPDSTNRVTRGRAAPSSVAAVRRETPRRVRGEKEEPHETEEALPALAVLVPPPSTAGSWREPRPGRRGRRSDERRPGRHALGRGRACEQALLDQQAGDEPDTGWGEVF